MAGAFSFLQQHGTVLMMTAWGLVVLAHVAYLGSFFRKRPAEPASVADTGSAGHGTRAVAAAVAPVRAYAPQDPDTQAARLFSIISDAAQSAERAISAHTQAARQLDSAEYQLRRLFDEFPLLASARRRKPLDVVPVTAHLAVSPAQALAA